MGANLSRHDAMDRLKRQSAYARSGLALLLGGALAATVFFFVANSVPLTALALSAVLLGTIALFLDRSLPEVPPRAAQLLLESGLTNLGSLLEEAGVSAKAWYLPSTLTGSQPRALIPLTASGQRPAISQLSTQRLIVEFGPRPEDLGLLVSTPGSSAVSFLDEPVGAKSPELESALTRLLVGVFDIARSVQVSQENGIVQVRVGGIRLYSGDLWVHRILGTPVASVTATVIAEGLKTPVIIESEVRTGETLDVRLGVAG
jgi:hypothetical protein